MSEETLFRQVCDLLTHAYAPYSDFPVAAAVIDEQGRAHLGVNVENAAYPQGACAETAAIGAMVTAGGRKIERVVLSAARVDDILPCGGCRQRIAEFASPTCEVVVVKDGAERRRIPFATLFPQPFALDGKA